MLPRIRQLLRRLSRLAGEFDRHLVWSILAAVTRSPRPRPVHRSGEGVVWESTGRATLEPIWGFPIGEPWRLHIETLRSQHDIPAWFDASPSPIDWWRVRRNEPGRIARFDEVISLRHFYEWNYFRFLIDVLPKLALLQRAGSDLSVPIVVGPSADELPFGIETRRLGRLAELDWYVQPRRTYVRADRVRFVGLDTPGRAGGTDYRARVESTLGMIGFDAIVEGVPHADRKVLLTGRPPYGRPIANAEEVEDALGGRGYEVVDAATASMVEQIHLFRQTRHLVAVQGAGMTSMIFRSGLPMSILELCPDVADPDTDVEAMRAMAVELGFLTQRERVPVAAHGDSARADLDVDVARLLRAVDELERAG